jgi:hypothetical protein
MDEEIFGVSKRHLISNAKRTIFFERSIKELNSIKNPLASSFVTETEERNKFIIPTKVAIRVSDESRSGSQMRDIRVLFGRSNVFQHFSLSFGFAERGRLFSS